MKKVLITFLASIITLLFTPAHALWPFSASAAKTCNDLAGSPREPGNKGQGVAFDSIDSQLAIEACTKALAEEPKSPQILYRLGRAWSAAKRDDLAFARFRTAAEQNYPPAQAALGLSYQQGMGQPQDDKLAVSWCKKAAEQGDAFAQYCLGFAYANARGVAMDADVATAWYRKAADQGLDDAQYALAVAYETGAGSLTRDEAQALSWYRKAAEQGNSFGQNRLGALYELGKGGLAKDDAQAFAWYQKAAQQGHMASQYEVGFRLMVGQSTTKNEAGGIELIRKSAAQNYQPAQTHLGLLYYGGGHGIEKNPEWARYWFEKAAKNGDPQAQYTLAVMYADGIGGSKNRDDAIKLLYPLANNENHRAMALLALVLYDDGQGSNNDLGKAVDFARAAIKGEDKYASRMAGDFWVKRLIADRRENISSDSAYSEAENSYYKTLEQNSMDGAFSTDVQKRLAFAKEVRSRRTYQYDSKSAATALVLGALAIVAIGGGLRGPDSEKDQKSSSWEKSWEAFWCPPMHHTSPFTGRCLPDN